MIKSLSKSIDLSRPCSVKNTFWKLTLLKISSYQTIEASSSSFAKIWFIRRRQHIRSFSNAVCLIYVGLSLPHTHCSQKCHFFQTKLSMWTWQSGKYSIPWVWHSVTRPPLKNHSYLPAPVQFLASHRQFWLLDHSLPRKWILVENPGDTLKAFPSIWMFKSASDYRQDHWLEMEIVPLRSMAWQYRNGWIREGLMPLFTR